VKPATSTARSSLFRKTSEAFTDFITGRWICINATGKLFVYGVPVPLPLWFSGVFFSGKFCRSIPKFHSTSFVSLYDMGNGHKCLIMKSSNQCLTVATLNVHDDMRNRHRNDQARSRIVWPGWLQGP
jgi:hypothetical protein